MKRWLYRQGPLYGYTFNPYLILQQLLTISEPHLSILVYDLICTSVAQNNPSPFVLWGPSFVFCLGPKQKSTSMFNMYFYKTKNYKMILIFQLGTDLQFRMRVYREKNCSKTGFSEF